MESRQRTSIKIVSGWHCCCGRRELSLAHLLHKPQDLRVLGVTICGAVIIISLCRGSVSVTGSSGGNERRDQVMCEFGNGKNVSSGRLSAVSATGHFFTEKIYDQLKADRCLVSRDE